MQLCATFKTILTTDYNQLLVELTQIYEIMCNVMYIYVCSRRFLSPKNVFQVFMQSIRISSCVANSLTKH